MHTHGQLATGPAITSGTTATSSSLRLVVETKEKPLHTTAQLRCLGPQVAPEQIVVGGDEVLVRQPKKRQFHELRTARLQTPEGSRYLSGTGANFLLVLWVLLLLCGAQQRWVTFVSDGARWLREFYEERLRGLPQREFVLDFLARWGEARDGGRRRKGRGSLPRRRK